MAVNDVLTEVKTIASKGKKLSKKAMARCQRLVEDLINTDEGLDALRSAVVEGGLHRQIVVFLIAIVTKSVSGDLSPKFKALLKTVIEHEKRNSPALWLALSSYCSSGAEDAKTLLKTSLSRLREPLKNAASNYEKLAFSNLKPDGMLGYLMELSESSTDAENRWLVPMIQCAARQLLEAPSLHSLTINSLRKRFERITASSSWQPDEATRLMVLLASQHVGSHPELREALIAVRPRIEQAPGQGWAIAIRKMDEALGFEIQKSVTAPVEKESSPLHGPLTVSEALRLVYTSLSGSVQRLGEVVAQVQGLEDLLKTAQKDKVRLKNEVEGLSAERAAVVSERDALSAKVRYLEEELRKVSHALHQAQREKEKAFALVKETEERARQDVGLARADAEHALTSFRFALWQDLRACFVEALDENYKNKANLSTEVRILLGRLSDALSALRKHGVAT